MHKLAILDLGSNSVRLVIYKNLERSSLTLINEKVLCELASDIETTSRLSIKGKELCEKALDRFIAICRSTKVKNIISFATAAIRDAIDGKEYVQYLENKYNIKIDIYSGEQEAENAGLGIISTYFRPKGIIADLGGGSLELAEISQNEIFHRTSHKLGVLRLKSMLETKQINLDALFEEKFREFHLNCKENYSNLYAIGGSFRLLAKIHMSHYNYPLRIIDQYQVKANHFYEALKKFKEFPPKYLKKISKSNKKRIANLDIIINIMQSLIKNLKPKYITFSAYGVREGVAYNILDEKQKNKDPLISACSNIIRKKEESLQYGFELANWLKELFYKEHYRYNRLILAACILSNLSRIEHNEYRAEHAYNNFIDSNLFSITHEERVYIATILYYRYSLKFNKKVMYPSIRLLNKSNLEECKKIGLAIKLANLISNSFPGLLENTKLRKDNEHLILEYNKNIQNIMGYEVEKILNKLAKMFDLKLLFYLSKK